MTAIDGGIAESPDVNNQIRPLRVPTWFRVGFRALGAIAPGIAAKLAKKLLFTPLRAGPRASDEERSVLERGKRFVLDVEGQQLIGYEWGKGPAVLLIHGWGGRSGHMSALVDPLVAAGFRAVAIDMAGHGESQGRACSIVDFSFAMERAAALFQPMAGVVAHSFGAGACTYAMSRGFRCERAVFFAPPARWESMWARFRAGVGVSPKVWQAVVHASEASLNFRFDSVHPIDFAPRMTAALLVLHAPDDQQLLYEEGVELVSRWPNATLQPAERRGHFRILRDSECVARTIAFLKGPHRVPIEA